MLDERIHPTEGGLEGREPIGGLFRNIEEDLRGIGHSLPLCCEIQKSRGWLMEGGESAYIDSDQRYSQRPRNLSNVVLETWCCWSGL